MTAGPRTARLIILTICLALLVGGSLLYWAAPGAAITAWQGVVRSISQLAPGRGEPSNSGRSGNLEPARAEEPATPTSITISAVGDVVLGTDERFDADLNFPSEVQRQQGDLSYFFGSVRDVLSHDDLTIANLEGTLTTLDRRADKRHQDRPFWFRGPPEFARILSLGSIEAVNLANNHSHDFGEAGYEDTEQALDAEGIGHFGYGSVYTETIKGVRIALAGFNQLGILELGTDFDELAADVTSTVTGLKAANDLVVASFHWGEEYSTIPTQDEVRLAHVAIDAGADLVVGHHPHVIQGIETYRGKQIVYSLGNFVYGGSSGLTDNGYSVIYQAMFTFDDHNLVTEDYQLVPALYSSSTDRNDYRPRVADDQAREDIMQTLFDRSILVDHLARGTPVKRVRDLATIRERMASDARTYDVPPLVNADSWQSAPSAALVDVTAVIPGIDYDPIYATPQNVTGQPLYDRDFPYLRVGTAKKLQRAQGLANKQGYRLRIWDGYRPPEAQWLLWNHTPNANYVASPLDSYSVHNRGAAVDVTLLDADGNELEMPSEFDDFTKRAWRSYSQATPKQIENARLLEAIMTEAGFETIQTEWWHFADSDQDDYGVIDIYAVLLRLNFAPILQCPVIPPAR